MPFWASSARFTGICRKSGFEISTGDMVAAVALALCWAEYLRVSEIFALPWNNITFPGEV